MAEDKPIPLPLSGDEIKEAVIFKVRESLSRTCNLRHDDAYTSFKAEITIRLTLSDYGREVKDNHMVKAGGDSELSQDAGNSLATRPGAGAGPEGPAPVLPRTVETTLTLEAQPPNQVRVETNQPVPVKTTVGGKPQIRHLKYAARKQVQPASGK